MNKWVVLVLMALAFLAGGLSFLTVGKGAATASVTPSAPQTTSVSISTTPVPVVASGSPVALARANGKPPEPHFGHPPKPGTARTPGGNPFGPDRKKPKHVGGEIKALIFSTSADGDSLTRFAPGAPSIYMTLTPAGIPDDVELVASIRSAMIEGEAFSAPVQSSGPPRRRSFRFTAPKTGWVSGPYQVVIKPADSEQVLSLSRFEVDKAGAAPRPSLAKPAYLDLVKDTSPEAAATSVFDQADEQVYLLVDAGKLPQSAKVRSVWSAVEVEQLTPGELVSVSEVNAPGPGKDAFFAFQPPQGGFLPGSYRVDVYFDQQPVGSQAFFIQPRSAATVSASPTASATPPL